MTKNAAVVDPSDVFEDMVLSTAFEPRSGSIEEKRHIFGKVWAEDISRLRDSFDSTGRNPGDDSHGFGFLVEAFARYSNKLPMRNTNKGEEAIRTILSELHSGKRGSIDLVHRRSNSDFLWVELTGRRITITGIGEVKASHKAASQKVGGQLKRQERSLEILVEELKSAKDQGTIQGFFHRRSVGVSDHLGKFLIVPYGEGEKTRCDKEFLDWKVVELEFSYNEIVFIAQQIWPDFRPDIRFRPGHLTSLFKITNELGEWIRPRLSNIFSDSNEFDSHNPMPCFELGLFFLATEKTPILESEVRWSAELVQKSFWPAVQGCLNLFTSSASQPDIDFSEREKAVFSKFLYLLTSNREDLKYFIYFLRSLDVQIKDLVRDQHHVRQLKNMSEVWTI